MPGAVKKDSPK